MDAFDVLWVGWLLFGGAVELVALARKDPDDTLSEHVWNWLRVRDPRPTAPFVGLRVTLGLVLVWLIGHFTMGWWTP